MKSVRLLTLSMVLFRLLSAQPQTDGEHWKITGHFHNDDWHVDAYGQNPAPFYRNPFLLPRIGPPYPWRPAVGTWPTTASLNPYYAALDLQVNTATSPTSIDLYGWIPVNSAPTGDAPLTPLQATPSSTGGYILPGSYCFAVSNGKGAVSHLITAVVPSGTSTNTITISGVTWGPAAYPANTLYLGENSQRLREGSLSSYTGSSPDVFGNPTVYLVTKINADQRGLPDINFDHFKFLVRDLYHGGAWGDAVSSVGVNTLTFNSASWTVNQWAGYVISLYYSPTSGGGAGTQPMADYFISSNTSNTLNLSGLHTLVAGDVVVCRFAASHITASTIGDDNTVNSYSPSGMTVNAEAGNMVMIVAGTGAGQPPATIKSNTATIVTIYGPWAVTPDSTSIWIIVSSAYRYRSETGAVRNDGTGTNTKAGSIIASNFLGGSLLIEGLTVRADGAPSVERFAPIRELYVPPSVGGGYYTILPTLAGIAPVDLTNGVNQRLVLPTTTLNGAIIVGATSLVVNTVVVNNTACPFSFNWDDGTGEVGTCSAISGTAWTIGASVNAHANGAVICTPVTFGAPTGGPVAGSELFLYLDQPASGNCPKPAFTGGVSGFVSTTAAQITIDGTASTRTAIGFKFHGAYWSMDSFNTGAAIT